MEETNEQENPAVTESPPIRSTRFTNLSSINCDGQDEIQGIFGSNSDETNLISSVRRRVQFSKEKVKTGSLNVLSAKYESLDYDTCENHLLLDEERKKGYKFIIRKSIARWVVFLLIGVCTALIACVIDISIEELSTLKYRSLSKSVDYYVTQGKLYIPYALWIVYNIVPVFIGSLLVTYGEPIAAGSGIPQVKCYLNGVKIPRVVRIKTLLVKSIGVICSVVGGLAGGKEGPMIHSGAVVAAGISQGKTTTFNKDFNFFHYFREDHEKRDFVSGGAAAGVSAAFGAPVVERYSNTRLRTQSHWAEIESSQNNDNPAAIRKLLDVFSENVSALNLLALPTDSWDFILTTMLLKRLDYELITRFKMEHRSTEIPNYSDLRIFLDKHCAALESLFVNRFAKFSVQKPRNSSSFVATNGKTNAISPSVNCLFCRKKHSLYTCTEFRNKSTYDRYNFVNQNLHVRNVILDSSHVYFILINVVVKELDKSGGEPNPGSSAIVTMGIVDNHITLLSTAWIDVNDNRGNYIPLRCLLDTESMSPIITQKALNKLGLKKTSTQIELKGIGSIQSNVNSGTVPLILKPQGESSPLVFTDAIVLNTICDDLPTFEFSCNNWSYIQNLKLADESFNTPGPIDLILGANTFAKIMLSGTVSGQEGGPTAFNTIFGYVLMGKTSANCSNKYNFDSYFCQSEIKSSEHDISLESAIKQLWEIESVPNVLTMTDDDRICEEIFSKTCKRDQTGKYIVSMSFYDADPIFPGIRDYAWERFQRLQPQLMKNTHVYDLYNQFMREYLDLDHMELVKPFQIRTI